MEQKLKPCPFCNGENIDYSVKTTGRWERKYHVAMYCKDCNCYGKRVLITPTETNRIEIGRNPYYRQIAEDAWNTREPLQKIIREIDQEIEVLTNKKQKSYKEGNYSRSHRSAERLCEAQFCKRIIMEIGKINE